MATFANLPMIAERNYKEEYVVHVDDWMKRTLEVRDDEGKLLRP